MSWAAVGLAAAMSIGRAAAWADDLPQDAPTHAEPPAATSLCAPAPVTPWLSVSAAEPAAPASPLTIAPPTPPAFTAMPALASNEANLAPMQLAAATLAGVGLVGALGWRLGRVPQLPFHPPLDEPRDPPRPAVTHRPADAEGWRLSRFDDLPEPGPTRPLRPLYESLDDVIDLVPLSTRLCPRRVERAGHSAHRLPHPSG